MSFEHLRVIKKDKLQTLWERSFASRFSVTFSGEKVSLCNIFFRHWQTG